MILSTGLLPTTDETRKLNLVSGVDSIGLQQSKHHGLAAGSLHQDHPVSGQDLYFLDPTLAYLQPHLQGLNPSAMVVMLSEDMDAIEQFRGALREVSFLRSVHVMTHGSEGQFQFGNAFVDSDYLRERREEFAAIAKLFPSGTDWYLYGCGVAQGINGQSFLREFSRAMNCDVAASNDPTGEAALGGDWDLEVTVGMVEPNGMEANLSTALNGLLPIEISAAGAEGDETMSLLIDGVPVQTWSNIGGDAYGGVFNTFSYQNVGPLELDRIRVRFDNDLQLNDGTDRDLRVDWIRVDGLTIQTESPTVFSTGTWLPADGVQPGFRESEYLHTDGYFQYGGHPKVVPAAHGITSFDSLWRTVTIPSTLSAPVLFAGSLSQNDDQPGSVSISKSAGQFRIRFREWTYLDGIHGSEQIAWLAAEPGRYQTLDGSIWEIGRFTLSATQAWGTQTFSGFFPQTPHVFLTRQSTTNVTPTITRLRSVSSNGFEAALFAEEIRQPEPLAAETIGYLAIYAPQPNGTVKLSTQDLPYSLQIGDVDSTIRQLPNGVHYWYQEEQSKDQEVQHSSETISTLLLGDVDLGTGGLVQLQSTNQSDPGSVRSVKVRPAIGGQFGKQLINTGWTTVGLDSPIDQVVIASPPSYRDEAPGVAAIRKVQDNSFEVRFREWNYLDQSHSDEWIDWLALQPGRYLTGDGSVWEVGTFTLKGNAGWAHRDFSLPFSVKPKLFLTSQTTDGNQPAIIRARNITANGFEAALYEEQAQLGTSHGRETVAYLALVGGAGSGVVPIGPTAVPYLTESKSVNHALTPLSNNVKIKLEEEQSGDDEVLHSYETVDAIRLGTLVFAQATTFSGGDVIGLRIEKGLPAVQLPTGFVLEHIAAEDDLSDAVALELAPDGRQFVATQSGLVSVIKNGRKLAQPLIDLSGEVFNLFSDEGALTGFVLDPNFAVNGRFFLMYTVQENGLTFGRIVSYQTSTANPDVADMSTRRVLIGISPSDGLEKGAFHNTGDMEFGTDGSLLISWGDTASNDASDPRLFLAQQLNRLAGKILRINPENGWGYSSNPFFTGNPQDNASKVWAYGLRNGFRFEVNTFDSSTNPEVGRPGLIYVGEVGRYFYDELNICRGGENFGWPYFEGPLTYLPGGNGLNVTDPVMSFAHPETRSVIGGTFYLGSTWPEQYRNRFFMADFVEGWIRTYTANADHTSVSESGFATGIKGMTDMEYDPLTQSIYLTGVGADSIFFDDQGLSGLYRIRYIG